LKRICAVVWKAPSLPAKILVYHRNEGVKITRREDKKSK
jgi:hypothetical protein